jgi:cytochrome b561
VPAGAKEVGVSLHVLFGALLWICVVARFYRRVHRGPFMPPNDLRALVRTLSRFVYLVLYLLMFFRIAIAILRSAPHQTVFGALDDFQGYLAGGIIALGTIRALAALYRYFGFEGARGALRYGSAKRPAKVA